MWAWSFCPSMRTLIDNSHTTPPLITLAQALTCSHVHFSICLICFLPVTFTGVDPSTSCQTTLAPLGEPNLQQITNIVSPPPPPSTPHLSPQPSFVWSSLVCLEGKPSHYFKKSETPVKSTRPYIAFLGGPNVRTPGHI